MILVQRFVVFTAWREDRWGEKEWSSVVIIIGCDHEIIITTAGRYVAGVAIERSFGNHTLWEET